MNENRIISESDREYWRTWAEVLPAPAGTIFDARSYNAWKLTQPISPPGEYGVKENK